MSVDRAVLGRVEYCGGAVRSAVQQVAADDSPQSREELRQAADEMMRALAAVILELEQDAAEDAAADAPASSR